jgi:TolB protein
VVTEGGLDGIHEQPRRRLRDLDDRSDGMGLTRLTHSPGNDAHPAWSPDGKWIAFSSGRGRFKDEMARGGGGQPTPDVFVMRADGTDVRRLTDDAVEEGTVTFAPKR